MEENTKKKKDYAHPTKGQLFWRVIGECWRRVLTPFLMYLFMGLTALALAMLINNVIANIVVGVLCLLCGAAFNAHLCYNFGKDHYDTYVAGCLHRKNELFGIPAGNGHHVEKEYRPWKGFLIGFFIGVPVLILAGLSALAPSWALYIYIFVAYWALQPVTWIMSYGQESWAVVGGTFTVSPLWSMFSVIIPIVVSGVFYIVGAYINRRNRELGKFPDPNEKKKSKEKKK